jgi:hypothetical protein
MTLSQSVCDVLREHVVLESECIDRMYLNVYVPQLQRVGGVVWYLRGHLGQRFASTASVAPKTVAFVASIEKFVAEQGVDLVSFGKHQRKDDVTRQYLQQFDATEGVLYVGRAQEKARVVRTERRRCARTGMSYPWVVDGSAMVNQYYFYCVDDDFGPFFLKFCSYFPYNAKLCINGNEYAKCQLRKRGIAFEALDNGILSCEDPKALQRICDGLDDRKIDRLLRKWLVRLPHPFDRRDRSAGYRYVLSILQAEFALTQVLDRPVTGRIFFEQVIRENLDIGRPGQVQLIFDRRVNRRTPGRFRTRVITEGVSTTRRVRRYVLRPLSTTPTTSAWDGCCATCPSCDASALQPIGACLKLSRSATTVHWARTRFRTCSVHAMLMGSVLRHCALPTRRSRPCCMRW